MREKIMGFIGGVVIASLLALCIQPAIASVEDNLEKTSVETRVKAAEVNTGVATAKSNATTADNLLTKWDNPMAEQMSGMDAVYADIVTKATRYDLAAAVYGAKSLEALDTAALIRYDLAKEKFEMGDKLDDGLYFWRVISNSPDLLYLKVKSDSKTTHDVQDKTLGVAQFIQEYGFKERAHTVYTIYDYKTGKRTTVNGPSKALIEKIGTEAAKTGFEYWINDTETNSTTGVTTYYYVDVSGNICSTTDATKTCYKVPILGLMYTDVEQKCRLLSSETYWAS